jgi:hypothetical protein
VQAAWSASEGFVEAKLRYVMDPMCPPGLMDRVVAALFKQPSIQRMRPPRWKTGVQIVLAGVGTVRVALETVEGDTQLVVSARPPRAASDPGDRELKLAKCWRMIKWLHPLLNDVFVTWTGLDVDTIASINFCRSVHKPEELCERFAPGAGGVSSLDVSLFHMKLGKEYAREGHIRSHSHSHVKMHDGGIPWTKYLWSSFAGAGRNKYVVTIDHGEGSSFHDHRVACNHGEGFMIPEDFGASRIDLNPPASLDTATYSYCGFQSWAAYETAFAQPQQAPSAAGAATIDIFLSHKQCDAQDLAKALKLYYESDRFRHTCFLDRDCRDDLSDLTQIVGRSCVTVVLLSPNYMDSPWCMLELLAAVMQDPADLPIVFVKVEGFSLDQVGFPTKLEAMAFPHAARLKAIMVLKHSRDFWDEAMGVRVADRIAFLCARRPSPSPAVSQAGVLQAFEALRLRRNAAFPSLRQWDRM